VFCGSLFSDPPLAEHLTPVRKEARLTVPWGPQSVLPGSR
jgi:hypothetical protein